MTRWKTHSRTKCLALVCALLIGLPMLSSAVHILPPLEGQASNEAALTYLASDQDGLYILRTDGLYQYTAGDAQARQIADFAARGFDGAGTALPEAMGFFRSSEGLCLAGGAWGPLWRYDELAGHFVQVFDRNPEGEGDQSLYRGFFGFEGRIYLIQTDLTTAVSQLMTLDLEAREPRPLRGGIALAAPYRPGELLVMHDERMLGGGLGWRSMS